MEGCVSAKYRVASEYWFAMLLRYGMDELPITLEYAWFSSTTSTTGPCGVGGGGVGGGGVGGGGVGGGGAGGVVVAVWGAALLPPPQPIAKIAASVVANRKMPRTNLETDRMAHPRNYGTSHLCNKVTARSARRTRNAVRVPRCNQSRCWCKLRVGRSQVRIADRRLTP